MIAQPEAGTTAAPITWQSAPLHMELGAEQVDVWAIPFDGLDRRTFFQMWLTLATDEHGRAQRFLHEDDRARYVYSRGMLRSILSRYLNCEPDEIRFEYGAHGKPKLASVHDTSLSFNVSHSDSLMVAAVAWGMSIGIDVERIVECDMDAITRRSFTVTERACLGALNGEQRARAFYATWTRKEAYLKATGAGFTLGVEDVEVSVLPWEPTTILRSPVPNHVFEWSLADLPLGSDHVGALAAGRRDVQVRYWRTSLPA